jgi:FkbM family methyltransferase
MDPLSRTLMTLGCMDADAIPKVAGAGGIRVEDGRRVQLMHNGVKVVAGGYHGDWMAHIIRGLRGHHEPQEEWLFHHVLRFVRHGSVMVELGSFWAYYSLWFLHEVPGSEALCVEPDPNHMAIGQRNAQLNGMSDSIRFVEAWIGGRQTASCSHVCESTGQQRALPCLDAQAVLDLCGGRDIELMHVDAQGAELPLLKSMRSIVGQGRIRFVMISTHHAAIGGGRCTHEDCLDAVAQLGGRVLAEYDVHESFSGDGLVLASFLPADRNISLPPVSRNRARYSLFAEM